MIDLSKFPLRNIRNVDWRYWAKGLSFLLCCIGLPYGGFSQISFENAFPSLSFAFPVEIQNTGVSGDDRLFVVGQRGTIQAFDNEASTGAAQQFLDIRSDVLFNVGQELGLLGLAFHPNYEENGYFYVYYTQAAGSNPKIVVERFRVNASNPNQADKSSRSVLFSVVKNQSNSNHNGGKIAFGPDGYLYISIGDGGGGGDPQKNGQNVNTYFGSILRLDVDLDGNNPPDANGLAPEGRYEVPSDNPLVNREGLDEIYAWGIRNTWKMSFDPPTGRLWGGDVGQNAFEEINLIVSGNFGWNRFEGTSVYNESIPDPGNAIPPVFSYNRSNGDRSITGGYVYRGSEVTSTTPSIVGKYIFGDYVSGRVWALDYNATTQEASRELLFKASDGSSINVSTFGLDINGEMYFAGYGSSGAIYQLKDGSTSENAVAVEGVGRWSDDLGDINGEVNAIVTAEDGTVYVGGDFTEVAGTTASNIARWTSSDGWQALGEGANGVVNALALDADGSLYVGGSFTSTGNTSASNVAKYTNAQSWESLTGGVSGAVLAMTTIDNTLYAGGAFVTANGEKVNNVARWNGAWSPLKDSNTQEVGTNNEIRSMAVDEAENLYVGGNFGSAGGNSASRIAQWNGSEWSSLGEGTSGFVQSILITEDYIYAGGNFAIAGGQTVNRIARWDRSSSTWSSLNSGLSNSVNALATDGNFLYVGGQFRNALNAEPQDNIIVNNVVRWSEEAGWEALGENTDVGVDNFVNTLYLEGLEMYIGGRFETAGNLNTQNLATWTNPAVLPSGPRILSLTLIGADSRDVRTLRDGDVIDYAALGERKLNIRADTDPQKVKRVEFTLNGELFATERLLPYALAGDFPGQPLYKFVTLEPGQYTLSVVPYVEEVGYGEPRTVDFTIIDSTEDTEEAALGASPESSVVKMTPNAVSVYPIPARDQLNVQFAQRISTPLQLIMTDVTGRQYQVLEMQSGKRSVTLDLKGQKKGIYILRFVSPQESQVRRIVVE